MGKSRHSHVAHLEAVDHHEVHTLLEYRSDDPFLDTLQIDRERH
jgi:hypothetical protein